MRLAFVHSAELEQYAYPAQCPFRPERAGLARRKLIAMGLLGSAGRMEVAPAPASREALLGFHQAPYLDALQAADEGRLDGATPTSGLGTADCPVFRGMYPYAALACGASLRGAELLLDGTADVAFNLSGGYHHAHADHASGFCYLNDVVLACQRMATAGQRVLFLDIDVHHCDGVQAAFYQRRDILTLSFHEDPALLFPGTGTVDEIGTGEGQGYTVNVPLPAGLYDEAFLRAFRALAIPLIDAYRPDLIVLELGMDMLAGDPLAHMSLTNNAHAEVVDYLRCAGRPLLVTGGGGYHVDNTVRGWVLAWSILCGEGKAADALSMGLGGVFLGTSEWHGGLRDGITIPTARQRDQVDLVVDATIKQIQATVFPWHGL
ncbi:MAG: hypothetical protein A2W31_00430 [Planctomycetes bacterium RBG_16_64_10]|nr:MAG: hypothetical protein A2W31_00430 [Planctomycetes bacterium RBG_16_64_10]